jgi:hypothetical protein
MKQSTTISTSNAISFRQERTELSQQRRWQRSLRKETPEPVFGIIKSALGFRQFSLRGLDNARGEWSLVTMAWNIKRMFVLNPA